MWIILTIFCVILGSGLVLGPMLALEYWRQDGPIAAKLVGLTIGRTLFDLVSLVALLYVWNRDLVSEWWLVILWLPIIGLCTAAFKFTEIKLARGVSFPNR